MIDSDGAARASADQITTLDAERGNKQAGGKFGLETSRQPSPVLFEAAVVKATWSRRGSKPRQRTHSAADRKT
jgi:hypothetical protein